MRKIVLASASPRRKEILTRLGYAFTVHPADIDEGVVGGSLTQRVTELAYLKARHIAPLERDALIIASDTMVAVDGELMGKPASPEDAVRMLERLSGNVNTVASGLCVWDTESGKYLRDCAVSYVYFKTLTADEILSYVATGEPMGKAGAYAIQGGAGKFIEKIEGSFDNIVGFPTELFNDMAGNFRWQ